MLDLLTDQHGSIESRLHELGWLRDDEHVVHLSPAGDGNMNRTLRAELGDRSLILKQSVPFVARYPEIPAPVERIEVEAAFYRATQQTNVSANLPELIGFDPANRLLALEDLGAAADLTDVYDGRGTPPELPELFKWLTRLHGLVLDHTDSRVFENRSMRALNHQHIFEIPFTPNNGLDLDTHAAGLADFAAGFIAAPRLQERVAELGRWYLGQGDGSAGVLLHGDYYPGSWLRTAKGIRIIDPEFTFIGPAEFDIGVCLAHMTFAGASADDLAAAADSYSAPRRHDVALARGFAGVEVMRRLLGVAQLPLDATLDTRIGWLEAARDAVENA